MMTINKLQRDALDMAVQAVSNELDVQIYTMRDTFFEKKKPVQYGVNWSAQGTQPADETRKYALKLLQAAEIVEALNKLELVTDYRDDSEWSGDFEGFKAKALAITKAIKLADANEIRLSINRLM